MSAITDNPDCSAAEARFLATIWAALGGPQEYLPRSTIVGQGQLPSVYAVTPLAAASLSAVGLAVCELIDTTALNSATAAGPRQCQVDRRLASLWYDYSLFPQGWDLPPIWDSVAGVYRCADGWIRLHTNAPHHRQAALQVLGFDPSSAANVCREQVSQLSASWQRQDLETAIVENHGCAAALNTAAQWASHEQGLAVAAEPLIWRETHAPQPVNAWQPLHERPLHGIKVLDLTRVLAGPVATRTLAGLGADVLRIDPPNWDEPAVVPDVTLGKRCTRVDLKTTSGRQHFERLLQQTDILVHGYRNGALQALGLGSAPLRSIKPDLIEVSLNAYGWTGPWQRRRGFDSLVQMSCGIADRGMQLLGKSQPHPLPVQALDHCSGYLLAAAALRALGERQRSGSGARARLSLARVAKLLSDHLPARHCETADEKQGRVKAQIINTATQTDFDPQIENTVWGAARRLRSPLTVSAVPLQWSLPASALGSSPPQWKNQT